MSDVSHVSGMSETRRVIAVSDYRAETLSTNIFMHFAQQIAFVGEAHMTEEDTII